MPWKGQALPAGTPFPTVSPTQTHLSCLIPPGLGEDDEHCGALFLEAHTGTRQKGQAPESHRADLLGAETRAEVLSMVTAQVEGGRG